MGEEPASLGPAAGAPPVIRIPPDALVVLVGAAGTGKSTWAARHFAPFQVVSSDACRALVADEPADQGATRDAFRLLHQLVDARLKRALLTVADTTALGAAARRELLHHAAEHGRPAVAVLFDLPVAVALEWNLRRERQVPGPALLAHDRQMREAGEHIASEGFARVYRLDSPWALDAAEVRIGGIRPDRDEPPFDVIGDVHGCADELADLFARLGYAPAGAGFRHPEGRRAVFVGDLVDRGPHSVRVLELALAMLDEGLALLVPGNHDNKFMRWLLGRPVRVAPQGLGLTIAELDALEPDARAELGRRALDALRAAPGYLTLDGGRLIVSHAGIRDEMVGFWTRPVAEFCLYGDVAGIEPQGRPIRRDWAAARRADDAAPLIVYGHTVVDEARWQNRTLDLDTGCVFGGRLSALRYPELELVGVPARRAYRDRRRGDGDGEG